MKNKLIFGVAVALCLLLLAQQRICAETTTDIIDTPKTGDILVNVPQTPKELLWVIKGLFANPDEDGHEFFEKQFGFDRTYWGKPLQEGWFERKAIDIYRINKLPISYHFNEAYLDRQDKVYKLVVTFYRNQDFLMTPDLTRKILGYPTKIYVSSPRNENSTGVYRITYRYETEKYYFDVIFINRVEENSKEILSRYIMHTPDKIENEQLHRKLFEIHKDYLPLSMELNRFEHPRFKRPL